MTQALQLLADIDRSLKDLPSRLVDAMARMPRGWDGGRSGDKDDEGGQGEAGDSSPAKAKKSEREAAYDAKLDAMLKQGMTIDGFPQMPGAQQRGALGAGAPWQEAAFDAKLRGSLSAQTAGTEGWQAARGLAGAVQPFGGLVGGAAGRIGSVMDAVERFAGNMDAAIAAAERFQKAFFPTSADREASGAKVGGVGADYQSGAADKLAEPHLKNFQGDVAKTQRSAQAGLGDQPGAGEVPALKAGAATAGAGAAAPADPSGPAAGASTVGATVTDGVQRFNALQGASAPSEPNLAMANQHAEGAATVNMDIGNLSRAFLTAGVGQQTAPGQMASHLADTIELQQKQLSGENTPGSGEAPSVGPDRAQGSPSNQNNNAAGGNLANDLQSAMSAAHNPINQAGGGTDDMARKLGTVMNVIQLAGAAGS